MPGIQNSISRTNPTNGYQGICSGLSNNRIYFVHSNLLREGNHWRNWYFKGASSESCLVFDEWPGENWPLVVHWQFLYLFSTVCCTVQMCDHNLWHSQEGLQSFPEGSEYSYCFNGPVTAVAWFDCRPVYFLTIIHSGPKPGTYSVSCLADRGSAISVPAPPCAIVYITYMWGVGWGGQMTSLYNCGRRSKKWWKRLF